MNSAQNRMLSAAIAFAILTPGVALAQEGQGRSKPSVLPAHLLLSTVDGASLRTSAGEEIGEIDDLILDTKANQVAFAIVSTGGFLGIGEQLTAVPYTLVQWRHGEEGALTLYVTQSKKHFEMAPKFEHDRLLEHLADPQWRAETRAAFGVYPKHAVRTPGEPSEERAVGARAGQEEGHAKRPARWCRAEVLTSASIVASRSVPDAKGPEEDGAAVRAQLEEFAEVDDLVIGRKDGLLTAVLVSRGGIAGIDEERLLIPCAALAQTPKSSALCVNQSLPKMQGAPRVEKDVVARLENEEFRAGLAKFYGVKLDG